MSHKTLPTARLTSVLLEALEVMTSHRNLQVGLSQLLKSLDEADSLEAIREKLRRLYDESQVPMPVAIPEAVAYLKTNGAKIARARNSARKSLGVLPVRPFLPRELLPSGPEDEILREPTEAERDSMMDEVPPLSIEEIEARLKSLDLAD